MAQHYEGKWHHIVAIGPELDPWTRHDRERLTGRDMVERAA